MNYIMVLLNLIQLSPWFRHHAQSVRLRRNQPSAEGVLLKHRFAKTEMFRSSFCNRTVDLWNALPDSTRKTKTCVAFKTQLFLSSISKDSTLHLVPVHCVLGQIHVNVYLVVAIDDTG